MQWSSDLILGGGKQCQMCGFAQRKRKHPPNYLPCGLTQDGATSVSDYGHKKKTSKACKGASGDYPKRATHQTLSPATTVKHSLARQPSVSADNVVHPLGSVFLLRAALDVAQQSNPSMAISLTSGARKVGWLACVRGCCLSLRCVRLF